jgi:hypothetical protein
MAFRRVNDVVAFENYVPERSFII